MSRLVRAAGSISFFTLLSRIAGLVRDSLMVQVLGAGWVQGTFLLAWTLPNLMRRLLGDSGLLGSSGRLAPMPTTRASLSSGIPAAINSRREALARSADRSQLL